jgi:hypothetical protein
MLKARQVPRLDSLGRCPRQPAGGRNPHALEGPRVADDGCLHRLPGPTPERADREHLGVLPVTGSAAVAGSRFLRRGHWCLGRFTVKEQ